MFVETPPATSARPDLADFPWPADAGQPRPVWKGDHFVVGDERVTVLTCEAARSGWTDDLTSFHEETAGTDHPIDLASRALALENLQLVRSLSPIVLEVGCSSGFMLRLIRANAPHTLLIGSDVVRSPLETLAESLPGVPLLHFDLTRCPLPDASLDAVIMLNVLEHIEDDAAALRQVQRILRPGGILTLEVPAGPRLYDVYDELLMHHRRYRRPELERLIRNAGFELERSTHLGVLIYPAFCAVKLRNRRYLSREQALKQRVVAANIRTTASSRLLRLLFRAELALGRRFDWPFGIRCIVAARKT